MKCDKCGNESNYEVKVLSAEQDIAYTQLPVEVLNKLLPLHMDVKWCLYQASNIIDRDIIYRIYRIYIFSPNAVIIKQHF